MIQTPSIGRTVHFVNEVGGHWPAIITRVWTDNTVNLQVLPDMAPAFTYSSALLDPLAGRRRSWHWPEAVPAAPATEPKGKKSP